MRTFLLTSIALTLAAASMTPVAAVGRECPKPSGHALDKHADPSGHRRECRLGRLTGLRVSKTGGLGQMELYRSELAAVLQRDEGIVSLIDVRDPFDMSILGRYDDGAQDSLDGDLAFSDDGQWLFYARQTVQFSRDGIHVLDISDRKNPRLASYQPGGGTFRIAYHRAGDAEYVVTLDAVEGLVVNRFVRPAGTLVPVFVDALPALKVGGPSSAGIFIDRRDPITKKPLMYVTTGETGLQVYDLSTPESPALLGAWDGVGLSDIEVAATEKERTVYAATEYWFSPTLKPEIVVLDATDLGAIKERDRWSYGLPAEDTWRIQGIDRHSGELFVAHSHAGVVVFGADGTVTRAAAAPFAHNAEAGATGSVYAMDVELRSPWGVLVSDASTGRLDVYAPPGPSGSYAGSP